MAISISLPAERVRRRVRLAFAVLLAGAIVALGAGALAVSRSSVFHARGIEVTGASHLSRAEVVRTAGVSTATNVLWLDERAAEAALEADPWVASAHVAVDLPWTIRIDVVERTPVAVAVNGLRRTLVAGDGGSLGAVERLHGLPRIELPPTAALGISESPSGAAVAIEAMPPALRAEVTEVTVFVGGDLEMRLRGGIHVRYGSSAEPQRKASVLARIFAWAQDAGERILAVNVVAPDAPAVRTAA